MEMISIIIPVYNVENYLKDCLDSAVNQSYKDKEIILIDDGSSDSSLSICNEYANRFRFIRVITKENGGLSSARNRGIEEAKGKWLIFLDSDDVWADKNCLTKLHEYAASLSLDVVRFEYQAVNEMLEFIEPRKYDKSYIEGCAIDNFNLVKYGIAGKWFAVLYLLKKEVINDIRFNEDTKFQEDIDFCCRLFSSRELKCGYLNEKMYLYRKRTASITTTCRIGNLKGSFDLCDVFYDSSFKTSDKRLQRLYVYYSVMMYYWTLQTLAASPYYEQRESIIKELKLISLHDRVVERINDLIERKYLIFIKPTTHVGVRLLHIKDKLRSFLP